MADRIRGCQEADVELHNAAFGLAQDFMDDGTAKRRLRCAALAFAHACELAHVREHETDKIDEWHETYPLEPEET